MERAKRRAYNQRREVVARWELDLTMRLLAIIEADRTQASRSAGATYPCSSEAVAIVHALNPRVGWLPLVWEY